MILLILVLLITVGLQIIGRYVDFIPRYLWTEEVANFSLTWVVFAGAILGVRENRHFMVDLLPERMPLWAELVTKTIYYCAMYLLTLVFIVYGFRFAQSGMIRRSVLIGVRLVIVYIGVPITGFSWAAFITQNLIEDVRRIRRRDTTTGEGQNQ
ncbi:TRAP transporter small permease subunit [candidate division GN15 bacterium]|nr:TRAP transporter small permease subunit [candidate division GN15 bacterium]